MSGPALLAGGARCAPPSARPGGVPRAGANGTLPRRGQDPSLRAIVHGCFVGSGLDHSAGWADISGLARRGGIHAAREPCAAANIPGGINSSPTHCPQTIFCMAGRRGRRPLRRLARKRLPAATPGSYKAPHFYLCPRAQTPPIYYLLSIYYLQHSWYDIPNPHLYTKRSDPF